jgi:hypothetical protein
MGCGVGVAVGVAVEAGVGVRLGVAVPTGDKLGRFGKMEQPAIEKASQSPKRMRRNFMPFLYWQKTGASSGYPSNKKALSCDRAFFEKLTLGRITRR